ncbi:MAG: hypothetical protein RLZZ297_1606, partial [Chloroflexota bacterium]
MQMLEMTRIASPVGEILLVSTATAVAFLDYHDYEDRMHQLLRSRYGTAYTLRSGADPHGVKDKLAAYFAGALTAIDDIPVETGGTAFQQAVWLALRTIPAGQTATYGQQAARIGNPTATRAVGRTNGLNPIAIVLPCHRVIGARGHSPAMRAGSSVKRGYS